MTTSLLYVAIQNAESFENKHAVELPREKKEGTSVNYSVIGVPFIQRISQYEQPNRGVVSKTKSMYACSVHYKGKKYESEEKTATMGVEVKK